MRKRLSALVAALVVAIVLPAAVIAHYPVANRYSYVSQGYWSGHRAYDLASYKGTPVVPVRSGKVIWAGWRNNCGGYQVWVSHGNGLYTAYYHLEKGTIAVWAGKWVTDQTTRLARVGESGCATGPHLHIEVWRGYPWRSGSYRVSPWTYIDSGTYLPYRYR
jgi:murein DD-endopeptidase MepM/ murein hydrolase activator NlpD